MQVGLVEQDNVGSVAALAAQVNPGGHLEHGKKELAESGRRRLELKHAVVGHALNEGGLRERVLRDLVEVLAHVVELPIAEQVVQNVIRVVLAVHVFRHLEQGVAKDRWLRTFLIITGNHLR